MAYTIIGKTPHSMTLNEWYKANNDVEYEFHDPKPNSTIFHAGADEMLRVAPDGFYVRGVRVPVDDKEAETVYLAFKQWLAWANLQRT